MAGKIVEVTRTQRAAGGTGLRGQIRIDRDSSLALFDGFIADEVLKLEEAPTVEPSVKSLSLPLPSDSFQVLHNDNVCALDYFLAHDVVVASHKTFLSAAQSPETSLGRFCSFALQHSSQVVELMNSCFWSFEYNAVACDGEVVYSEVDAENLLRSVVTDFDLFGKTEQEKASSFFVNSEQALDNFPTEIFHVAFGNCEGNFYPALQGANAQNIVFEGSAAWKIITNGSIRDFRFRLGLLDHSTRLLDAGYGELRLQAHCFQILVDEWLQLDVVSDVSTPRFVNAELQSSLVNIESFENGRFGWNFDFCSNHASHELGKTQEYLKLMEETGFLPLLKQGASALTIS